MAAPGSRFEVLYGPEEIARAVQRIALAVRRDLGRARVFAIPVMNGALFFAADLLRALASGLDLEGFGAASVASYGSGTAPEGPPRVAAFPPRERIEGRVVLVIDTILDTGATADVVMREARERGAADVKFACLLDKVARRTIPVRPDYAAFQAPDRFLVGYGLDAGGRLRTLPYVAAMVGEGA